jgi:hypothetical protein
MKAKKLQIYLFIFLLGSFFAFGRLSIAKTTEISVSVAESLSSSISKNMLEIISNSRQPLIILKNGEKLIDQNQIPIESNATYTIYQLP